MGPSSSSRGGGGDSGPGRSTPSAGRASDSYDRSNEQISSSIRGGGGDNDRVVSTNPGRPGGESGERSLTAGESISGSGDARSSFSFNARNSTPAMSTFRDSRSTISPSTTGTFRAARELSRNTQTSNVASMEPLDRTTPGYGMIVGDGELSEEEQARENRARVLDMQRPTDTIRAQRDAYLNAEETFEDRMTLPGIGAPQALFALGRNALMARDVVNQNNQMVADRNLAPETLNTTVSDMAAAMNSQSLAETTGILGNEMAVGQAAVGDYSAPEVNRQIGGGGSDQPYIPPQPVGPPPSRQSESAEREPRIGRLGEYSSYARRVFSRI